MKQVLFLPLVLLMIGFISAQSYAQDNTEAVIAYRQSVMKSIGGHFGAIANILKGRLVEYQDQLGAHARAIHEVSPFILSLFPEGTEFPDTRAKPEIWEQWSDFELAADKMIQASAKLEHATEGGNIRGIIDAFGELGKTCKGCHREYRMKK